MGVVLSQGKKAADPAGNFNHRPQFPIAQIRVTLELQVFHPGHVLRDADEAGIDFARWAKRRELNVIAQSRMLFRREPRVVLVREAVSNSRTDQQCCNRNIVNTKIAGRLPGSIWPAPAMTRPDPAPRDRFAHVGVRRPGFRPVAAVLTSCTGVLPACAAARDRVTARSLSVGQ
jgi:hypothetical protein